MPRAHWVDEGLSLATEQWELRHLRDSLKLNQKGKDKPNRDVADLQAMTLAKLARRREDLLRRLEAWLAAREVQMGAVAFERPSDVNAEDLPLGLPSRYEEKEREDHGLVELAEMELKMREGEAHELICALKSELRREFMLRRMLGDKKMAVSNVKKVTRQNKKAEASRENIKKLAARYRANRDDMLKLGLSPTDVTFRVLEDTDLNYRNAAQTVQSGQGKKRLGWLWKHGGQGEGQEWEKAGMPTHLISPSLAGAEVNAQLTACIISNTRPRWTGGKRRWPSWKRRGNGSSDFSGSTQMHGGLWPKRCSREDRGALWQTKRCRRVKSRTLTANRRCTARCAAVCSDCP